MFPIENRFVMLIHLRPNLLYGYICSNYVLVDHFGFLHMCETVDEMARDKKNDGVSTPKPIKATWTADFHEIFLDLCLEQINAGNKPGTHFTRVGWRNIEDSFMNNSGVFYEKKQFKNHWDNTKEQWKVWRKLIGTRSMKWDPDTRKFGASEEEWANYTQVRMT